jgi:type I restriction enzyme S subunit
MATDRYPAYRDSGLPWAPTLPEGWQVLRNGQLFAHRVQTGFPDLPILEVSLRTGVRVRDMVNLKRKQVMSQKAKYKRAAKGDIAYNMMRMWQGALGAAPVDGLVSPAYVVASPFPQINSAYYSYLFRTDAYMREVNKFSRGIVADRNRLYWDEFKQMPSVVPPLAEQDQIVAYGTVNKPVSFDEVRGMARADADSDGSDWAEGVSIRWALLHAARGELNA